MAITMVGATLGSLVLGLAPMAIGLLVAVFVIISLVLVLAVLIQKPQGGGLSGAFGAGGGSGQTAFGTKTGDVLTMTTISIFVLWLVFAVVLNFATRPPRAQAGPGVIQSSGTPADPSPTNPAPAGGPPAQEPASEVPAADSNTGEAIPGDVVPGEAIPSDPTSGGSTSGGSGDAGGSGADGSGG